MITDNNLSPLASMACGHVIHMPHGMSSSQRKGYSSNIVTIMNKPNYWKANTLFNKSDKAVLVYQAGIANIFRLTRRTTTRIMQSDFRTCENYFRGLRDAGINCVVAHCNMAGDIINQPWRYDSFDAAPFSESFAKDIVTVSDIDRGELETMPPYDC